MAVKILGGKARGFSLNTPKGNLIRPTSVVLRRKAFDTYQNWEGWIFIDACAGTGAMGIEAWSRGANKVYLIEKNPKVATVLQSNITKVKISYAQEGEAQAFVIANKSITSWMKNLKSLYENLSDEQKTNCLLFLDPPYHLKEIYERIIFKELIDQRWFKGWLWVESDEKKGITKAELEKKGLSFYDFIAQGDSFLAIIKVVDQR